MQEAVKVIQYSHTNALWTSMYTVNSPLLVGIPLMATSPILAGLQYRPALLLETMFVNVELNAKICR